MVKKEVKEEAQAPKPSSAILPLNKLKKRGRPSLMADIIKVDKPVFSANNFPEMTDLQFCFYVEQIAEKRLVGLSLVDSYGKFYFMSRIACEHWQASLNNFQSQGLFDIIPSISRGRIFKKLRQSVIKTVLKTTIYSKNNKRKWPTYAFTKETTVDDLYYRYLKSILMQIRPVSLTNQMENTDFDALMQDELVLDRNKLLNGPNNLFLIETRLASKMEKFDDELFKDPILKKFISRGLKKLKLEVKEEKDKKEEAEKEKVEQVASFKKKEQRKNSDDMIFGGKMRLNQDPI